MKVLFQLLILLGIPLSIFSQNTSMLLWYDKPATVWAEALPLGNGYMGAMVYGDPQNERIQLNEGTLYTGDPKGTYTSIDVRKAYKQVVDLIQAKKYKEVEAIIAKEWLGRNNQLYQPMGDLWLKFDHNNATVSDYKRSLDLTTATAMTQYKVGTTVHKRQYFANYPDHLIVIKLSAEDAKTGKAVDKINCTLRFSTSHTPTAQYSAQGNDLTMKGKVPGFGLRRTFELVEKLGDQHKYPEVFDKNGNRKPNAKNHLYDNEVNGWGMAFESGVRVLNKGGTIESKGDSMIIRNAKEVVLICTAATSFNGFDKSPVVGAGQDGINPHDLVEKYLKAVERKSFTDLYKTHLTDYKNLFDRVKIQLAAETEQSKLTTAKRIELFSNGKDPAFTALYFQYSRYLMIAGSRQGGQPLNLQGIWNDLMTPPWNGAYTMNINLQMNYWLANTTNLSECQEPYFRAIKELAKNGEKTASAMYGNQGWVAHHNMDIWRHAEPVDNCLCSFWPMGAGWLVSQFWEHYLFSGDKTFLKNDVFPLLKGAVQFYQGWLVKNTEGYLVTPIGHSPEHNFRYGDKQQGSFDAGVTLDMAIVKESFDRYLEACRILDIKDEFTESVRQNLSQLLPYQIGKYGQLQEWAEDFEDSDVKHRHFSHLYMMHPSNQVNRHSTPELAAAVERVLERRGDYATGWSMGWKTAMWARLLDGNHALKIVSNLFTPVKTNQISMQGGGTYPNLFCGHPPFQIDGNFGAAAGVTEMLLQSHAGEIHLLPALPQAWHTGSIKGLKARGGFTVDMEWANGKLLTASIHSALGGHCRIRTNEKMGLNTSFDTANGKNPNPLFSFIDAGKPIIKDASKMIETRVNQGFTIDFKTEKGKIYTLK